MAKEKDDALVKTNEQQSIQAAFGMDEEFDINSLEPTQRLQLMQEIMQAEAELETSALPIAKSKEIVGQPVTVHDAIFKTIVANGEQKECVNFLLENAGDSFDVKDNDGNILHSIQRGDLFTVLKGSNTFNDGYVMRFQKLRGVLRRPIVNMNFVVDSRWQKAGNPSIVLRKIQTQEKAVG